MLFDSVRSHACWCPEFSVTDGAFNNLVRKVTVPYMFEVTGPEFKVSAALVTCQKVILVGDQMVCQLLFSNQM